MGAEILSWKENPFSDSPAELQLAAVPADLDWVWSERAKERKKEEREKVSEPGNVFLDKVSRPKWLLKDSWIPLSLRFAFFVARASYSVEDVFWFFIIKTNAVVWLWSQLNS